LIRVFDPSHDRYFLGRAQSSGFGRSFWHVFAKGSKACKASQMLAVNVISRSFKCFVLGFDFESFKSSHVTITPNIVENRTPLTLEINDTKQAGWWYSSEKADWESAVVIWSGRLWE